MRKISLVLVCAALMTTLPAGMCSTAATVVEVATSSAPIGDRVRMDEQGLYYMEALYNVPANAYRSAATNNVPGWPSIRARVRPLLIQARGIRNLARAAYRVGDAASWNARVAELTRLNAEITAILPSN